MNLYSKKQKWKYLLAIIALVIVIAIIWYTSFIASKVRNEERLKVQLWGESIRKKAALVKLTNQSFSALAIKERENVEIWARATKEFEKPLSDYSFALTIIRNNVDTSDIEDNIPLILTDNNNKLISYVNLPEIDLLKEKDELVSNLISQWAEINAPVKISFSNEKSQNIYYNNSIRYYDLLNKRDSLLNSFKEDLLLNSALVPVIFFNENQDSIVASNIFLKNMSKKDSLKKINNIKDENQSFKVDLGEGKQGILFFQNSLTLKQLEYFPFILIGIIILFLFVAYLLFSTFRRAEQNQVWAGMAKETAHQLGTPISSLMAWIEILKSDNVDLSSINEMNKDINRLETITERFSKIGSTTKLEKINLIVVVKENVEYLKNRISKKINITVKSTQDNISILGDKSLIQWVIENLTKNAVDAMKGEGDLTFSFNIEKKLAILDVSDTGKGVDKLKTIFEPGYTTKKRGWGLGLSLAKRIIEEQHNGEIIILHSEIGKGTTFRIKIPLI